MQRLVDNARKDLAAKTSYIWGDCGCKARYLEYGSSGSGTSLQVQFGGGRWVNGEGEER